MKKVYLFLANGFEEVEAITPIDMLRRADIEVVTVSINETTEVVGAHNITVFADTVIEKVDCTDADMIVLPGGYPGFENLANCKKVIDIIDFCDKNDRYIAAICGAPAAVLGANGYLKDKRATCFPAMQDGLCCKRLHSGAVCVDGNYITSKSAGTAMSFAMVLVEKLAGVTLANNLKKSIVLDVE